MKIATPDVGNFDVTETTISLACRKYDRTAAIFAGGVQLKGINFGIIEITDVPGSFARMMAGEYDACEFSLGELVSRISRGEDELIGIPVFPLKMFRHGSIFSNVAAGIDSPQSLEGKKVALYRVSQTTCIWIRGILVDQYKVSPNTIEWYALTSDPLARSLVQAGTPSPDNSEVLLLEYDGNRREIDVLDSALCEARIDALCSAAVPPSYIKRDRRIQRLFENYREAEQAYYKTHQFIPIMHVLTVRRRIADKLPGLPEKLFRLFVEARHMGSRWVRGEGSVSMMWKDHYLVEEEQLGIGDPWAYGLATNYNVLNTFLRYCYEQGVSSKRMRPEDLFIQNTCNLEEISCF